MLKDVFEKLDLWIQEENVKRRDSGTFTLSKAVFRILGQTALLEAKLDLEVLGTADVDAVIDGEYSIKNKFDELLRPYGRHMDPDSDKIWMPQETQYDLFYSGKYVDGFLAKHEYVLLSKALKAPDRNRDLITEYLAKMPSPHFVKLAKKYHIDLTRFA